MRESTATIRIQRYCRTGEPRGLLYAQATNTVEPTIMAPIIPAVIIAPQNTEALCGGMPSNRPGGCGLAGQGIAGTSFLLSDVYLSRRQVAGQEEVVAGILSAAQGQADGERCPCCATDYRSPGGEMA